MDEKAINKLLKPGRVLLTITLIFILLTAGLFIAGALEGYQAKKNPTPLGDLIKDYAEKEGQYVKLDIAYVPYVFAEEGTNNVYYYYFAWDADKLMYIVRLTDKTFEEISKLKTDDSETIQYELKGYTFKITSKLKKIAIEVANEMFEEKVVTTSNFSDYFGSVYIDETEVPDNASGDVTYYGLGFCVGIFALMFVIIYVSRIKGTTNFRKNPEKLQEIKEELADLTDNPYSKLKVYLTRKYVMAKLTGLIAIPYKDIIWEYTQVHYRNGVAMNKSLIICTKDKKKLVIATGSPDDSNIEEIMVEIQDNNPEVKIGYTKENRLFFKNYTKENIN